MNPFIYCLFDRYLGYSKKNNPPVRDEQDSEMSTICPELFFRMP